MARSGGSRSGSGSGSAGRSGGKGGGKGSAKRTPQPRRRPEPKPPQAAAPVPAGPFVLGAIPGATPGKWIDTWNDRMPRVALELVPIAVADQRSRLLGEGDDSAAGAADLAAGTTLDAALVRLPIDKIGLHVIPLYDEVPVVVASAESHLMAAEELTLADLAGEIVITPDDDVLGVVVPGAIEPRFAPPTTTEDAVATVAAGVGVVIVPMSLARLHHRKDADHRRLVDGPVSTVALAWPAERTTVLVEAFVGIVRGRTANSSRA